MPSGLWPTQVSSLTQGAAASVTSTTSAWSSNVTAGNAIVVCFWVSYPQLRGSQAGSISDSYSSSYSFTSQSVNGSLPSDTSGIVGIAYAFSVTGGTKPTVTVACTTATEISFFMIEVQGLLGTLDGTDENATASAATSSSPNAGTWLTTNAQDFSVMVLGLKGASTIAIPSGYTDGRQQAGATGTGDGCYQVFGAAQASSAPAWSLGTAQGYAAVVVNFKAPVDPINGAFLMEMMGA
jgi:hypothetical protein